MTNEHRSDLTARIIASSRRPANLGTVTEGTVSLAMGEPFAETPDAVVKAAVASLQRGRTRYAPQTGEPALRRALAERLSHTHGAKIDEDQVILTHGASAGIAALILGLVDPGDRIVLPEPTYSLYADHVAMAGGTVTWVANHPDGRLDLDALAAAMPGSKAVIVCTPSNPTGRVIPKANLVALRGLADAAGTVLVSDEAYADIVFDGADAASVLSLARSVESICIGTFSKSYAKTGWRLG